MRLARAGRASDMAPGFWRVKRQSTTRFIRLRAKRWRRAVGASCTEAWSNLTIRVTDDTLTLTPAWIMRPGAAICAVRPFPRLSVGRLRDLRNHLDALLGSSPGDS